MNEPDFQNLLRLTKLIGGKFIIVEDGVPRAVLMDYDEFQKLAAPKATEKIAERINDVITKAQLFDLREEVMVEDAGQLLGGAAEEIRIEPL